MNRAELVLVLCNAMVAAAVTTVAVLWWYA